MQELLGGRFGEMSTLMNYMYQSFNFRGRDQSRPFYDLVALHRLGIRRDLEAIFDERARRVRVLLEPGRGPDRRANRDIGR